MYYKPDTRFVFLSFLLILYCGQSYSQLSYDSIKPAYIERTINYLASNKLKGRVNFTREQLEAAEFLSHEFEVAGLEPFPGVSNFYIPFRSATVFESREKLKWNDRRLNDSLFFYISSHLFASEANLNEFILVEAVYPLADSILFSYWKNTPRKILLWLSLPEKGSFSEATRNIVLPPGMPASDILIVADKVKPKSVYYFPNKNQVNSVLYNVIGMLPGDMLTGSNYSDLYEIMHKNLKDQEVRIRELTSDPNMLFQRSDNYSFARKGVPAHTIMCSDDYEPCYHKSCDDSKRIDII